MGYFDFLIESDAASGVRPAKKKPIPGKTPDFVPTLPKMDFSLQTEETAGGPQGIGPEVLTSSKVPRPAPSLTPHSVKRGESQKKVIALADKLTAGRFPALADPELQERVSLAFRNKPEEAAQAVEDYFREGYSRSGGQGEEAMKLLLQNPQYRELLKAVKEYRGLLSEPGEEELQRKIVGGNLPSLKQQVTAGEGHLAKLQQHLSGLKAQYPGAVSEIERKDLQSQINETRNEIKRTHIELNEAKGNVMTAEEKLESSTPKPSDTSMSGQSLAQSFKMVSHSVSPNKDIPLAKGAMDFKERIDPGSKIEMMQPGPMGLQLRTILDRLPPEMQRKFLDGLNSAFGKKGALDKDIDKTLKEAEEVDTEALAIKARRDKTLEELQAARGMNTFGGTLLWVLFSLTIGPKMAALIMVNREREGQLEMDLRELDAQMKAMYQERAWRARIQEQAASRAAEKERDYIFRRQEAQDRRDWQSTLLAYKEAHDLNDDAYKKVVQVKVGLNAQIDDLANEMNRYSQAMKEIPGELMTEYEALLARRESVQRTLEIAADQARQKAGQQPAFERKE